MSKLDSIADPKEKMAIAELMSMYDIRDSNFEIDHYGNVVKLEMKEKGLQKVPKEIERLTNLKHLDLQNPGAAVYPGFCRSKC